MKRIAELFVTVCFLGFLAALTMITLLREPETASFFENRTLAAFPEYTAQSAGDGAYFSQLERYLSDHTAMRNLMLWLKAHADLALRRPVVNDIVITPERLLPYLTPDTAQPEQLAAQAQTMADSLKSINDTVEAYGGYFCFVAVPCQYSYFEDGYPWFLENLSERSALSVSLLSQELTERGVPFLDIRAAFDERGRPEEYGSSVDNHFTMTGAFETYRLIMEKAAAETGLEFPILSAEDLSFETLPNEYMGSRERILANVEKRDEQLTAACPKQPVPFTRTDSGYDASPVVYDIPDSGDALITYSLYMGGDMPNTVIDTGRDGLPSILIYGDSFTNAVECVAYLSFDEMHSLDFRYYREMSLSDYIRMLQPELVVCIRDYQALLDNWGNGAVE